MKLTIDRNIWLRGEPKESYLLRPSDNKMCCIGIWLKELGCPLESLKGVGTAYSVRNHYTSGLSWKGVPEWACTSDGKLSLIDYLYSTNDASGIPDSNREKEITKYFAQQDIEVEFIN